MMRPKALDRLGSLGLGRLCSEAIRNRSARLTLTLTLLLVWSGAALLVYVTERDAAQASAAYSASMLRDGYATLLIGQSDSALEKLTWPNCHTMRNLPGTRAVVGLREPVTLRLWTARGPEIAVREAMGDVASFLSTTSLSAGDRRVSPSVIFDVQSLGARPAGETEAQYVTRIVQQNGDSDTRTAATEDLVGFGGGFSGNAIMVAPPGGEISTCVVLTELESREHVATIASSLFPIGVGYGQQWALPNSDRLDPPRDRYEHRASRWHWLGAVTLIALTWAFSLWILRSDLAVFSVAGLRTPQIFFLAVAEMLVVLSGAALVTLAVAAYDYYTRTDARAFVVTGFRELARVAMASLGLCATIAAATASAISHRTIAALKDR